MTKITLEDAAFSCDRRGASQEKKRQAAEAKGLNNETFNHRTTRNKWQRHAALCRSAQLVIEAAEVRKMGGHSTNCGIRKATPATNVHCTCGQTELKAALAAHAKNEQGTGE